MATELKLLNIDVLEALRKTIDWLVEKYKSISNASEKNKLSKVANQISKLVSNKKAYLLVLKENIAKNDEFVNQQAIVEALEKADLDTQTLSALIKELDAKEISFSLKEGLESLANVKGVTVGQLKSMISKDSATASDQEEVINKLEAFEQQWIELGNRIDPLLKS